MYSRLPMRFGDVDRLTESMRLRSIAGGDEEIIPAVFQPATRGSRLCSRPEFAQP